MNIFLNEYFGICFELNFELNHFSARFNEKMNFQNVSHTPSNVWRERLIKIVKNPFMQMLRRLNALSCSNNEYWGLFAKIKNTIYAQCGTKEVRC